MFRTIKLLLLAVLLSGVFLFASPRPALACSCMGFTPQQALARADVVFVGRVIDQSQTLFSLEGVSVFRVFTIWKGPQITKITINTEQPNMCSSRFELNREYLVYAHKGQNGFTTSTCSRTKLAADAQEDFAALGPGTPIIAADPVDSTNQPISDITIFGIVAIVTLGVVALGAVLFMRRANRERNAA